MSNCLRSVVVCGALFGVGACVDAEQTSDVGQETASSGTVGTITASASLGDAKTEIKWGAHASEIKGPTRLIMQDITIQPGGHTGWHTHGGLALVSIVQGTLTFYEQEAPCVGRAFAAGSALMDPGHDHFHIAYNHGTTPVLLKVQYILPEGAPVRVDGVAPPGSENCAY